jgi:hypothetical protein
MLGASIAFLIESPQVEPIYEKRPHPLSCSPH